MKLFHPDDIEIVMQAVDNYAAAVQAPRGFVYNSRYYIPDGAWVKAKLSGGIRYVTRQTSKDCFEDDGVLSGMAPSPHCAYKNYRPLQSDELDQIPNRVKKDVV